MKTPLRHRTISQTIGQTYVIAYREPTDQLIQTLEAEQFTVELHRQAPNPKFANYSPSYRCLLNHQSAWEKIAQATQPGLIIEADFAPVKNFGQLPVPYPTDLDNTGIAWLYTCAPQIYTVTHQGYAPGFSVASVAYILTPAAAQALLNLHHRHPDPTRYSSWDSEVEEFLRDRQFINYVPFRNYGEHGGIPNPEHRQHGLSSFHRADTLYDRLAFMPLYAKTPWQYYQARLQARLKGIVRLLTGRFLRPKIMSESSSPFRLLRFAITRQFSHR
jgi:GR25 family glycosyltransferase involved in LPS biosynthesis